MSGGAYLSVPVYPGVDVGGHIDFATTHAASDTSINIAAVQRQVWGESLVTPYPSEYFKSLIPQTAGMSHDDKMKFYRQHCGDEFVTQIDNGSSVVTAINLDFGNSEAKNNLGVGMVLSLLGGIGTVDATVRLRLEHVADKLHVSMGVQQIGGQPEMLTKLFPDGLPSCSVEKDEAQGVRFSDTCQKALKMLVDYTYGASGTSDLAGVKTYAEQIAKSRIKFPAAFKLSQC